MALFTPNDLLERPIDDLPTRGDYATLIAAGGYPEALRVPDTLRDSWFDAYLSTVVLRDISSFADIRRSTLIPQLLRLVAARSSGRLVLADLASTLGLSLPTVRTYLGYLDVVYLCAHLPVWSASPTTRLSKTPKMYVTDSGLAVSLVGASQASIVEPGNAFSGMLVETFVHSELLRQLATSPARADLRFFRDRDGREVDFILERRDGAIVGIKVKSSSTVASNDFKHLSWLRERLGERFAAGDVLYLGAESRPLGERLAALPLGALWKSRPPLLRPE